jgi:hypothetical protein
MRMLRLLCAATEHIYICAAWVHACRAGRNFGRTFGSNMASQAMYLNLERLGAQVGVRCFLHDFRIQTNSSLNSTPPVAAASRTNDMLFE